MAMMKKTGLFLLVLLLTAGAAYAERLAALGELMKPQLLTMDKDRFYVAEETTIFIYSLKDFKLLKKFGKTGEGPQEFLQYAFVIPTANELLVSSQGKLSLFSKDGEYKKEMKSTTRAFMYYPLSDGFVGLGGQLEDNIIYLTVEKFDGDLKKTAELLRYQNPQKRGGKINPVSVRQPLFFVDGDKVFVEERDKGLIHCVDANGKKVAAIKPELKRRKVTAADEKGYRDFYKNDARTKNIYAAVLNRIEFPAYYPPFDFLWVKDGKIYVLTFTQKDGASEFIVLDTTGKEIKRPMVPYHIPNVLDRAPSDVRDGKLYQIIENEDEEEWELHVTPIL